MRGENRKFDVQNDETRYGRHSETGGIDGGRSEGMEECIECIK